MLVLVDFLYLFQLGFPSGMQPETRRQTKIYSKNNIERFQTYLMLNPGNQQNVNQRIFFCCIYSMQDGWKTNK